MLRMEINVGVRFILFGFTKVTVILLFTIVFALTEIKTIVMILNRPWMMIHVALKIYLKTEQPKNGYFQKISKGI